VTSREDAQAASWGLELGVLKAGFDLDAKVLGNSSWRSFSLQECITGQQRRALTFIACFSIVTVYSSS
jgi:hypothetical protein